jgi:Ricin-type beta-trefoil lectin domain-like
MKKICYSFLLHVLLLLLSATSAAQVIRGTYAIKNIQTGMLLRIKDANGKNGTPLVAYTPLNWKCMTWDFKHIDSNTYQLQNLFTSKTFQCEKGVAAEGVLMEQQPLVMKQINQQYVFIAVKKDVYLIRVKGRDLYLTPVDKNGTTDTGITLLKNDGSTLQKWTIYEQKPTM